MKEQTIRFRLDGMPCQTGDPMGIYIRKHADISANAHFHDCYEIEVISSGEVTQIINSIPYHAKKGDAFLLTPNDFHKLEINHEVELYNIMFKEDVLHKHHIQSIFQHVMNENINCHFNKQEYLYIQTILNEALCEYQARETNFEYVLKDTINILVSKLLRRTNVNPSAKMQDDYIRKAIMYMQMNCQNSPSLADVAAYVGLNPTYFSDKFHQNVGITFKKCLNEFKLNRALQLLCTTDFPISDICFLSGFSSFSNYYNEFKRFYGITPKAARDRNNNNF